jgi:hypothetical protein
VIESATLTETPVVGTPTAALELTYVGNPEAPTLAYQWKIGNAASSAFTDIAGATSATYTPIADDVGKYIKCEVMASGTATGTVLTNAKKVAAE